MVSFVAFSVAGLAGVVTLVDPTRAFRFAAFIIGVLFIVVALLGGALHT